MGRAAVKAKERAAAAQRRAAAGGDAMFVGDSTKRQMGRSAAKRRQDRRKREKEIQRAAGPSFIEQVDITGNKNQEVVSVVNGMVNLKYYESLLQDHVAADITFVDAGNAIHNKTALSGLPIVGEENVQLKFSDNNGNTLAFNNKGNNAFYVKKVTTIGDSTTDSSVNLQLITKEAIKNDKVSVMTREDGKISEHVKKVLTDKEYLATQKDVSDIEETANNLNYCMANMKPYYILNKISKDAVPNGNSNANALGNSAGFIFYETSEGFHFKSIDGLMKGEQKLSVIFNDTPSSTIPEGYDVKALSYSKDNKMDVSKKLKFGAWNTKIQTWNPFNMEYSVSSFSAAEKQEYLELAGKELPYFNKEFDSGEENKNFSRTTFMINAPGILPTGSGLGEEQQQLTKSKEIEFDAPSILNQSIMRYNQLFSSQVTIVIPADLSLHAGDAIFFDSAELKETKSKACGDEVNKTSGGKYIIATLCHYLTPKQSYTKLVMIRDSVGREGNHTKR